MTGQRTRLELFVGKGGVGKTTLAAATAAARARAGQRVLIASLDQAHSLGDAFGVRFPHDAGTVAGIATVAPNLEIVELDSLALLEDRFADVARMLAADARHRHDGFDPGALDPAELTGLPGVQELLVLVEIAQYVAEEQYDVVVLDCPPTADMLRIVTAPDTLLGYLSRIWPEHDRALSKAGTDLRRAVLAATVDRIVTAVTEVRDLLADRSRTGARLVTLAERLSAAESARVRSAAALLGLRLDAVLVNKVLPPVPAVPDLAAAHPSVRWYLGLRAEQLAVLDELRRAMPEVPVLVTEHRGAEPIGADALAALSIPVDTAPMLGDNPADGPGPVVSRESGSGLSSVYTLRMPLPVVDPATLRLGRVEDELIVGADGVRRRVPLAPVLRRCTVSGAELDGGALVVRFRPDPEEWPR
ncbi:ArsA family ATPase [Nocardia sp. NPDC050697]|uniref:ArsA family ATPase n=1 Tax=Nocardia sp. NPDC050697 TaxID=3155158 RepID=UPI003401887D